jgi:hypothetical protein
MTTVRTWVIALTGLLALGVTASSAPGQYYVPLRYDLRYSLNPGYVTAIPYAQAPTRPDPYAYGSPLYSGLDLTGNVRAGKSFQGNTPFNQQGSQLSTNVPSLALSNFRRDSIGIGDIGTGVEYGMAAPYFPGSASVTSLGTAARRFGPDMNSRYSTPNYNAANVGMVSVPATAGFYAGSTPPPDVPTAQLQTLRRGGLYLPRGAIEWVNALSQPPPPPGAAQVPTVQPEELNPELRRMDMRLGLPLPPTDVRIGLPPELGGQAVPMPVGPVDLAAEAQRKAAAEAAQAKAAGTTETNETAPSAIEQRLRGGAARKSPREAPRTTIGALPGAVPGAPMGQGEESGLPVPASPGRYLGPATFGEYIARAGAQMKESHYGAADALYEAAMVMDPSQPSALFGRVCALLADYRYLQASLVLDRALRLHPDWASQIPDIKSVYVKPEVLTRITGDMRTNLEDRPKNVEANLLLGFIAFASGEKEQAKPFLKQVAEVRGPRPGSEQAFLKAIEAAEKPK